MKKSLTAVMLLMGLMASFTFSFSFSLWAQEPNRKRDTEFWESFGVDIQLDNRFKLYLEKQLRYEDSFSNLEADLMEAGIRVRLFKFMTFRVNYRYTIRQNNKRYRFDANLYFNFRLNPSKKWQSVRLSSRTKLQKEYKEDGIFNDSEWELRNRLKLEVPFTRPIRPYLGAEWFKGLGDMGRLRDKLRLTLGVEWRVKGSITIKPFYHFQTDLVSGLSETTHIFGTKLNVSL
jgi:hypothetical protein